MGTASLLRTRKSREGSTATPGLTSTTRRNRGERCAEEEIKVGDEGDEEKGERGEGAVSGVARSLLMLQLLLMLLMSACTGHRRASAWLIELQFWRASSALRKWR